MQLFDVNLSPITGSKYYTTLFSDSNTGSGGTLDITTKAFGDAASLMPDGKYTVRLRCTSSSNYSEIVEGPTTIRASIKDGIITQAKSIINEIYSASSKYSFGTCVFEIYDIEFYSPLS